MKNIIKAAIALLAIFSTVAYAGGSSNNDGGGQSSPYAADLIFKINDSSIFYREDAYMLVCVDKKKRVIDSCRDTDDHMTLDAFWKWYFPTAPTIHVVSMDYRTYYSTYIFWLKR